MRTGPALRSIAHFTARAALAAALAMGLAACMDIGEIPAGLCGNAIIDAAAGEDCDSHPNGGMPCGAVGSAHACRYDCSADPGACAPGWGCGADGICRAASGTFTQASTLPSS